MAGWVVLTETGLEVTPFSVSRTPGIAFSMMLDSDVRAALAVDVERGVEGRTGAVVGGDLGQRARRRAADESTVKSELAPVLRAEKTIRSTPPSLITAA